MLRRNPEFVGMDPLGRPQLVVVRDPWGLLADEIIAREALETPQQRKKENIILAAGSLVMLAAEAVAVKGFIVNDIELAVEGALVAGLAGGISSAALIVNNFKKVMTASRRFWLDS